MTGLSTFRLVLAALLAPAIPLLMIGLWMGNGNTAGVGITLLTGYAFFALLGPPFVGALVHTRSLRSCIVAGAVVTVIPVLLLHALSFTGLGGSDMGGLSVLVLAGALGGLLFWVIAFAGTRQSSGSATEPVH